MKSFRMINFNLDEKYIINKVSSNSLINVIKNIEPEVITLQNVSNNTFNILSNRLKNNYSVIRSINLSSNIIMIQNKNLILYLDSIAEEKSYNLIGNKYRNCQLAIIENNKHFISIINSDISYSKLKKYNLNKLVKFYELSNSNNIADVKIVISNYTNQKYLKKMNQLYQLVDISINYDFMEGFLINKGVKINDVDVCKIKKKFYGEVTGTVLDINL